MAVVTERDRMVLRQWAEEHMGESTAEVLMNCLPPKGWGDLATKSAVEGVRTEVAALRTDVEKDLKAMEQGLSDRFTAQLATEIGAVTKEIAKVHEKIGEVHEKIGEVHAKIGDVGRTQSWQIVTLIVAIVLAVFGPTVVERVFPPPSQVVTQSPAG